jgi:hypothetical protein
VLVVGLLAPAPVDAAAPDASRAAPFEVAGPLVVEPTEGGIVALGRTRLFGTLELRRDGERVRPIVELDLESYLLGIADMPASYGTGTGTKRRRCRAGGPWADS